MTVTHGSWVLLFLAVLCFVLAAFGIQFPIQIVPLGLAFFAAAFFLYNRTV